MAEIQDLALATLPESTNAQDAPKNLSSNEGISRENAGIVPSVSRDESQNDTQRVRSRIRTIAVLAGLYVSHLTMF